MLGSSPSTTMLLASLKDMEGVEGVQVWSSGGTAVNI